ncbi:uncharacterized protein METZ01_LOCUS84568 [marine metagenome]|uniref:Uncharacterized protein n=1 Tax=marine metagenome TaxID=408172 RepID=A0A381UUR8_9ZZZZ
MDITTFEKVLFQDEAGNKLIEESTVTGKKYLLAKNRNGETVTDKDFQIIAKRSGLGLNPKFYRKNGRKFVKYRGSSDTLDEMANKLASFKGL